MRAKEFILTESEGGMMRRAEEAQRGKRVAFKNAAGNVISILDTAVFPQDKDAADNYQLLAQDITSYVTQNGVSVSSTLTLPPGAGLTSPEKAGAALVMIFQDETTKNKIAWIALKPAKKPGAYPFFMQTKQFSDLTGYTQLSGKKGEEGKISGVQQRALTNLKPVGIIPTNIDITVDDIPSQVASFLQQRNDLTQDIKDQVVLLLEEVAAGSSNPVAGAGNYAKSYEIDLGETAAPIALVKKKFLSGAWQQAENGMGLKFESASGVEFPNDPAEKLYDSYLKFPGGASEETGTDSEIIIRVSSKDKQGGAKASVSGVVDDISNYPDRYEGLFDPAINPGFDQMLEIVKIIKEPDMAFVASSNQWKRNGSIAGALQLGVKVSVISSEQAKRILSVIDSDQQQVDDEELGDLKTILQYKGTDDASRPDYRVGWHLLAGVAAEVANRVNKNYKTDAFFKAVLERSNMIQVKTTLKQSAGKDQQGNATSGAYFSNFEVIYPQVFTGTIKLDAGSNFYATRRPVGKMGFSIK